MCVAGNGGVHSADHALEKETDDVLVAFVRMVDARLGEDNIFPLQPGEYVGGQSVSPDCMTGTEWLAMGLSIKTILLKVLALAEVVGTFRGLVLGFVLVWFDS